MYKKGFDLWSDAVQERLDLFGYNKLEGEKVRKAILNFHIHPFFLIFSLLLAQSPSLIGSSTLLSCFRKQNKKILGFLWIPLSWVMKATTIIAIALAHGGVSPYDLSVFF